MWQRWRKAGRGEPQLGQVNEKFETATSHCFVQRYNRRERHGAAPASMPTQTPRRLRQTSLLMGQQPQQVRARHAWRRASPRTRKNWQNACRSKIRVRSEQRQEPPRNASQAVRSKSWKSAHARRRTVRQTGTVINGGFGGSGVQAEKERLKYARNRRH